MQLLQVHCCTALQGESLCLWLAPDLAGLAETQDGGTGPSKTHECARQRCKVGLAGFQSGAEV